MKNKKFFNEGITLIALVITIIVLLILAGVTIASLTGDNGILTRARQAQEDTKIQGALEKVQIAVLGSFNVRGGEANLLDYQSLKENLEAIDGYESMSVTGEITEASFPITVTVDGEEMRININGEVERIDDSSIDYDEKFDISENQDESVIAYVKGNNMMITGEGNTKDYGYYQSPFTELSNTITQIEVGEGITSLGDALFQADSCREVTNVQLPKTLKKIGQGVFYYMSKLDRVTFNGTKAEWLAIEIENGGSHNHYLTFQATIVCTDGEIEK